MKNIRGFTIVELMIATSVFSIILLLSLAGFLQIGHLFYKGVNITQTSNVLNQSISSLKNDILFNNNDSDVTIHNAADVVLVDGTIIPRKYFCTGTNRYGFILHRKLDRDEQRQEMFGPPATDSSTWYRFALLKDKSATCSNPFDAASPNRFNANTVIELLGDNMRLSQLEISPLSPPNDKLYTINIKIAYGDDEVLENFDQPSAACKNNPAYSKYCFVSSIRTTVRKGL